VRYYGVEIHRVSFCFLLRHLALDMWISSFRLSCMWRK
jgi:hypothetical protein